MVLVPWYHGQNGAGTAGAEPLKKGETLSVVWEASSGGKTQTLFRYDVQ
jgi:hypothetical protein